MTTNATLTVYVPDPLYNNTRLCEIVLLFSFLFMFYNPEPCERATSLLRIGHRSSRVVPDGRLFLMKIQEERKGDGKDGAQSGVVGG